MSTDRERPSYDEELALALELIEDGDREHAARHLAGAAAERPGAEAVRAAVRDLCDGSDDPLALAPATEGYIGTVVLRGLIAARCGHLTEALVQLLRAEELDPGPGYLAAMDADGFSEATLQGVVAERVGNVLAPLVAASDSLPEPARSRLLSAAETVIEMLVEWHAGDEGFAFASCMLYRRLDKPERAVEVARTSLRHAPSYRAASALGAALRDCGDCDGAAEAYRLAASLDPDDEAVWLDLGDTFGAAGRFEAALEGYEGALARAPSQPWALASQYYYRWLLLDDPADLAKLAELAGSEEPTHGGGTHDGRAAANPRAQALYVQTRAYEDWLPSRPEALLKMFAHEMDPDSVVRCAITSLEAPSAVMVAMTLQPNLELSMGEAEGVDPRVPRTSVRTVLWRYRVSGTWPVRRLTNEAENVAGEVVPDLDARLRALASSHYSATGWFEDAQRSAHELGDDWSIAACCASMLTPGAPPDGMSLQDWTFRKQVAGAFVVAQLPSGRDALWDIVHGPVDWVAEAAITALAQLAIDQPSQRLQIARDLVAQIGAVPSPIGYMCLTAPAALNVLRIPELPSALRATAVSARNAWLADG